MDESSAQWQSNSERSAFPLAWGLLLYVPLVLAGSLIGAMLRYPDLGSAILFPPYAVLTAALIAAPRRDWIWYILLASLTHLIAGVAHWPALFLLLADVANVSRAVIAALLLQRLLGRQPRLDSVPSLLLFVAAAGIVAPTVGAAIGAADVVLFQPSRHYLETWNAWFISNALTALTMLPFLLSVMRPPTAWRRFSVDPRRLMEGTILGLCLIAVCAFVLVSFKGDRFSLSVALYTPIPLLIWAALRFGPAGVGLALTLATFAAIVGTDRQALATLDASPDSRVLHLQVFVLLTAGPVMCITVVATA
ncbi:MAG TPA: MASE1 domain-containing protein, partial [Gemmatimonadaceae bacterium]|nr:MASE1 domain-containing protein [Gemmatimonadaceae bacterium]